MQFLVDEDLPRSTHALLERYNHASKDVRDIGLRGAKDFQIAAYARSNGLCLLTGDLDFSNIQKLFHLENTQGSVVLRLPGTATASFILSLLGKFSAGERPCHPNARQDGHSGIRPSSESGPHRQRIRARDVGSKTTC